jgi:cellulose synthase operon protein C
MPLSFLCRTARVQTLTRALLVTAAALAATPTLADPAVDESGLRYFARTGDRERLAAEIARLEALHPGWTPPADPLADTPAPDPEVEAIWSLISEGKPREARAALVALGRERPDWQPPADLTERITLAENRARLVNASDAKQAATVVSVAAENPALLTCADVDVLWRLAEAFAATDRPDRATDVYGYILDTCTAVPDRLASIEKASLVLDRPRLDALLARERPGASDDPEFANIRLELARRAVAAAGAENGTPASADDTARLAAAFDAAPTASDALLLAWASYREGQRREAERWFRRAGEIEASAEAARGLALVQIDEGAYAAAEATMDPWRDASDEAEAVYLAAAANLLAGDPPPPLDTATLARIVPAVMDARDPRVAQQLGWYARAFGQNSVAADWFATALSWDPASEPAAFGLALTRRDLGDTAGLAELQKVWDARSPRIAALDDPAPAPAAAATPAPAASSPESRATTKPAASRSSAAPTTRGCGGSSLAQGWCLMDANRPLEAARAFARAGESGSAKQRSDAAYGESLAYLRQGLTDRAAAAALKAPLSADRQRELQAAILADRATAAFRQGRYSETLVALDQRAALAGERVDLMVLRGYAYLKLRRKSEARRVFAAAARTGDAEAQKGLRLVNESYLGR